MGARVIRHGAARQVLLLVLAVSGCGDAEEPDDARHAVPPEWTARAARDALDRAGLFILGRPTVRVGEREPEAISTLVDSVALWLRTAPDYIQDGYARSAGREIHYSGLERCGRAYYVRSPFRTIPDAPPNYFRNAAGSQWRYVLCDRAGPAFSVLMAGNTDLFFVDGWPTFPRVSGNGLIVEAINGLAGSFLSPEEAVHRVREEFGGTVVSVPEAYGLIYYLVEDLCAAWRVALQEPVLISAPTGESVETTDLFVSIAGCTTATPPGSILFASPDTVKVMTLPVNVIDSLTGETTASSVTLELDGPSRLVPVAGGRP